MPDARRPLIAGNWKMNGLKDASRELRTIVQRQSDVAAKADLLLCPPATLICAFADIAAETAVAIGGQDCHGSAAGAHTGDLSAEMLKDAGATAVILGHSERRADHNETDAIVQDKVRAACRAGLVAIVCVGETQIERDAGRAMEVVGRQLAGSLPDGVTAASLVVAYEPVWAIGTGRTPTAADVEEIHGFIRGKLTNRFSREGGAIRILYGGSVKPSNATELMSVRNVDGALVGGASLKASDFLAIAAACP